MAGVINNRSFQLVYNNQQVSFAQMEEPQVLNLTSDVKKMINSERGAALGKGICCALATTVAAGATIVAINTLYRGSVRVIYHHAWNLAHSTTDFEGLSRAVSATFATPLASLTGVFTGKKAYEYISHFQKVNQLNERKFTAFANHYGLAITQETFKAVLEEYLKAESDPAYALELEANHRALLPKDQINALLENGFILTYESRDEMPLAECVGHQVENDADRVQEIMASERWTRVKKGIFYGVATAGAITITLLAIGTLDGASLKLIYHHAANAGGWHHATSILLTTQPIIAAFGGPGGYLVTLLTGKKVFECITHYQELNSVNTEELTAFANRYGFEITPKTFNAVANAYKKTKVNNAYTLQLEAYRRALHTEIVPA